jgi:transcription antitermination factor NusG
MFRTGAASPEIESDAASAITPHWYAVYTAANQEKTVADRLRQRGIEQYLPLYKMVRRRTDRKVALQRPLFPGYLFVHIDPAERKSVLELPRVVRLVGNGAVPLAVPDAQIERLQQALSAGRGVFPCSQLRKGHRIRVTQGPFSGVEGILLRRKHDLRIVVSIELIARSFSIEVAEEDIECVS